MFTRASRQDEIFEDCVTALLEGRRSIEDSLSRYPSLAHQLGPLLETTAGVSNDLSKQPLPSTEAQDQIRARLLVHARTLAIEGRHSPWLDARWAFLGGAGAVAVISLLILAAALIALR